jgi:hypothetical protein
MNIEGKVSASRKDVLDGLMLSPKTKLQEMIGTGFEAAKLTIAMMRQTFKRIPPMAIVDAFGNSDGRLKDKAKLLWDKFGKKTIKNMQSEAPLLAVLRESARMVGGGEQKVTKTSSLS